MPPVALDLPERAAEILHGAEQMPFDASFAEIERAGHLVGRHALDVAEREHLALPRGQPLKRRRDPHAELGAGRRLLGRGAAVHQLEHLGCPVPAAPGPPARPAAVAAGVDRHPGEPRRPVDRHDRALVGADELEKHFLGDLFGLRLVAEDQAPQPHQPCRVLAVEGFAMGLPSRCCLAVHGVTLLLCPFSVCRRTIDRSG